MHNLKNRVILLLLITLFQGCAITFLGASIDRGITTFFIGEFQTRIPNVPIDLVSKLTEELADKLGTLPNISQVKKDGKIHFEGVIESFTITTSTTTNSSNVNEQKKDLLLW